MKKRCNDAKHEKWKRNRDKNEKRVVKNERIIKRADFRKMMKHNNNDKYKKWVKNMNKKHERRIKKEEKNEGK